MYDSATFERGHIGTKAIAAKKTNRQLHKRGTGPEVGGEASNFQVVRSSLDTYTMDSWFQRTFSEERVSPNIVCEAGIFGSARKFSLKTSLNGRTTLSQSLSFVSKYFNIPVDDFQISLGHYENSLGEIDLNTELSSSATLVIVDESRYKVKEGRRVSFVSREAGRKHDDGRLFDEERFVAVGSSSKHSAVSWREVDWESRDTDCGDCFGCCWHGLHASCASSNLESHGLALGFVTDDECRRSFLLVTRLLLTPDHEPAFCNFANFETGTVEEVKLGFGSFTFSVSSEVELIPIDRILGRCELYLNACSGGGHFVNYRKNMVEYF
jgi:hypothetical protein